MDEIRTKVAGQDERNIKTKYRIKCSYIIQKLYKKLEQGV